MTRRELIADALFPHLTLKRCNERHPTIMAAADSILAALVAAEQAESTAKVRSDQ